MLKVNLLVVFRTIFLKFTQKRDLASSTSERAKRRLRKPSKLSIVSTSEASERAKRSLRKSSKPSIVRMSEASFASEQAKSIIRKPAKAKQTMPRLNTRNSTIWLSFWCYTPWASQINQAKQTKKSKQTGERATELVSKQTTNQASNQLTNQSTNQASNQSTNQPTNQSTKK